MKTLLLTTAITLTLAAPSAFADHDYHQDGQDAVAFGYGNGYSYGFGNPNYHQFNPGYGPLNSGWSVGAFNPGWNAGWNNGRTSNCQSGYGQGLGYGQGFGYQPGFGSQFDYGRPQFDSILPGGCSRIGGQEFCPGSTRGRVHVPYGQYGGYGNVIPLR
jgi:hypothetical protein